MNALKDIKAEIRTLIGDRTRDGVVIHAAWLTTEVMGKYSEVHGDDAALYVILAHKALGEIVKECIGKYEPKAQTEGQLVLPGFDHVQRAYPVVRGGERVLVPTDLLTDEEIDDRCEDLRVMARGCIAHVKELEAFRDMRRAASAVAAQ
jgi:hypothetical protein